MLKRNEHWKFTRKSYAEAVTGALGGSTEVGTSEIRAADKNSKIELRQFKYDQK